MELAMKKAFACLLLLLAAPALCLAADKFDFRGIDFGMSRKAVKSHEKGRLINEDAIGLGYVIENRFGVAAMAFYDFTPDNKLASIGYEMLPRTDNADVAFAKYAEIKAYLCELYGPPSVYEEIHDYATDAPLSEEVRATGLMDGSLCLWTLWETDDLEVLLFMESVSDELTIRLNNKNKALFVNM